MPLPAIETAATDSTPLDHEPLLDEKRAAAFISINISMSKRLLGDRVPGSSDLSLPNP